jgi:hypothetical protein
MSMLEKYPKIVWFSEILIQRSESLFCLFLKQFRVGVSDLDAGCPLDKNESLVQPAQTDGHLPCLRQAHRVELLPFPSHVESRNRKVTF